jgi:hypothetical protein
VFDGCLRCEDESEHVEVKLLVKMLDSHVLQRSEFIDARVIDENVELVERLFRLRKKALDIRLLGDVCLDGDRCPAFAADLVHDPVGPFLTARVVDDDGGPFISQVLRDGGADALGRSRNDSHFAYKSLGHDVIPLL